MTIFFIRIGKPSVDLSHTISRRNFGNPKPERITPKKLWCGFLWWEGIGARISSFSCLRDRLCDFGQLQQPGSAIHRVFQVLSQQGRKSAWKRSNGEGIPDSRCPSLNATRLFQSCSVNRNCLWTLKKHALYHSRMVLISLSRRSKQAFYYKLHETHLLPSHSLAGNKIQLAKMVRV